MKDLLVSLPSYHRKVQDTRCKDDRKGPAKLKYTIEMIFNTCNNKDNFDLQIIINEDQKEIYKDIINKYPNLIYTFIKGGFTDIIEAQHKIMKKGYYFCCNLGDDVYGFNKYWDRHIMNKKYAFKDDLFLMYTSSTFSNRKKLYYENCYANKDVPDKHESVPVWTYKWGEFTYDMFPKKFKLGREVLYAFIAKFLYEKGFNRHVECKLNYTHFEDDGTTGELIKADEEFYKDLNIKMNPEIQAMIQHINVHKAKEYIKPKNIA